MSPDLAPRRAERDGCDCPVIRCAHAEELLIWLDYNRLAVWYRVCGPASRKDHDGRCLKGVARFPDLPSAEAEFARREAILLGRAPEGSEA